MAVGTVLTFDKSLVSLTNGDWATTDQIKIGLIDSTATPSRTEAAPTWTTTYLTNEVATTANYTTGGTNLDDLTTSVVVDGVGVIFDSSVNPFWTAIAGGDTDCTWGIIYNDTFTGKPAIAFIELGTVNMATSTLTITWDALGLFKIAHA
jgi:hypothetical protein